MLCIKFELVARLSSIVVALAMEGSQIVRVVSRFFREFSMVWESNIAPNRTSTLIEEYAMALVESREGFDAPLLWYQCSGNTGYFFCTSRTFSKLLKLVAALSRQLFQFNGNKDMADLLKIMLIRHLRPY